MERMMTISTGIPARSGASFDEVMTRYAARVSATTRESYGVCLRSFFAWLRENGITAPTTEDVYAYVEYLSKPHARRLRPDQDEKYATVIHMSEGTQARYLRALKTFFKWTAEAGYYADITAGVKGARVNMTEHKRDDISPEEARAVLDRIDRSTVEGKRDYAMLLLIATCALRIIEVQRANVEDLQTVKGSRVLFIQGKGHAAKDDYKKLTAEVQDAIDDYLNARPKAAKGSALFAGAGNRSRGQRLTEPSVSRIIKDRLKAAGIDNHRQTAHSWRHASITWLLKSGATIQEAQMHARHMNPATTEIYAHNISKEDSHFEQRVFNYLFGVEEDPAETAAHLLHSMNADKQKKALELLRAIAN